MEGINLFLAGEFKKCIFIIGMDAEMVAAALEVTHDEVISKLPKYSIDSPIGWRFMDKFIQLSFSIPPKENIAQYIESLIDKKSNLSPEENRNNISMNKDSNNEFESLKLSYKEQRERQDKITKIANERINRISPSDKEFRESLIQLTSSFSRNPRDLKRFMNVLDFSVFCEKP